MDGTFIERVCDINMEMRYVAGNSEIKPFYIGAFAVTQKQWFKIMNTSIDMQKNKVNPSVSINSVGPDYPMYYVNWGDANEFCLTLSNITGKRYRLPSNIEWEYAACECDNLKDIAWYKDNSNGRIHSCGCKKSNAFGLYDMYGNVWEWCKDVYDRDGLMRIIRGGDWRSHSSYCLHYSRLYAIANIRNEYIGFRVVADVM